MKKYVYLIIIVLISSLVLAGCTLLSNIGQVPTSEQSGIAYLTKGSSLGLVGWWRFSDNADDSSDYGNHGTVFGGAIYDPSPMGKALIFDGMDDYVEVVDHPSLRVQELTIEAWVNLDMLSGRQIIIRKSIDSIWGSFSLQVEPDGHLRLTVQDKTKLKWPVWRTTSPLTTGGWYHIAGTFKRQNYNESDGKIYIDGSQKTTTFAANGYATGFMIEYTDGGLFIGIQHGQSYPLDGTIDDVRIWNVALSQDQLGKVYNFDSFFSPVENLPTVNEVKAGRAIPVKFSLSGDQGLNIFEMGYPKSMEIACTAGESVPIGEIPTDTAGGSILNYDAEADQYIYVWKTDKSWTGCRQLVVRLNDGKSYYANFKFK